MNLKAALGALVSVLVVGTVSAQEVSTWDADIINSEDVAQTGDGVYVAVLDTGLVPNWRDYFPLASIAENLGTGFDQSVTFKASNADPCGYETEVGPLRQTTWVGSTNSTHGTHVTSTIVGYNYYSNFDAAGGYPLPPIYVPGIAPGVKVIPVKVLADYQIPALPGCTDPNVITSAHGVTFGTSAMVAAGIDYVAGLARSGLRPIVINMSLGGPELEDVERAALDRAIAAGVIVVASAGNEGEAGMGYPGGYAPVISVGSAGWIGEWLRPGTAPAVSNRYRMWWLKREGPPLLPGSGDVADPTVTDDVYVSDFSSRALSSSPQPQQLDVLAPGSWVRGPFAGDPGFSHLPWHSKGIGDLVGSNPGNFYYVGGTSMASPHVASLAALMLEKNPALAQSQIESILKSTALRLRSSGSRLILDNTVVETVTWDTSCVVNGKSQRCDPVGSGLVDAVKAVAAVP